MEKTFIGALLHFFQRKESQTLDDFRIEVSKLSTEDREYFIKHLGSVGYKVIPSK